MDADVLWHAAFVSTCDDLQLLDRGCADLQCTREEVAMQTELCQQGFDGLR